MINSKSTKAQLLEYIGKLQADVDSLERQLAASKPVTPATVLDELVSALTDAYRFERWCAKGFQRVVAELRAVCYDSFA